MKQYFTAFSMTQSMFCALPFPCKCWDEKARPYMLLFLPVVGLEIGVLWALLHWLMTYLQLPILVTALCMCAFPYLATGLIHLDGYLDVVDAISSWRDLEQRRVILKDPHVGSFAVVWCVFLILTGFALFSSIPENRDMRVLILIPVVTRCCSALAVIHLPALPSSQFRQMTYYPKWHSFVFIGLIVLSLICAFLLWDGNGFAVLGALIGYVLALQRSYCALQGMNGDISGFCLTIAELCGVGVLALI